MHIRADGCMNQNDMDGWDFTAFEELAADWDDLASSLTRKQWLTGVRAFDHVNNLDNDAQRVIPERKTLLNKLYRGYALMQCTSYAPPRMMSRRYWKNGLEHIKNEFQDSAHSSLARNQNARCDKMGETDPSQHDVTVETDEERCG